MNRRFRFLFALLGVLTLVAASCGDDSTSEADAEPEVSAPTGDPVDTAEDPEPVEPIDESAPRDFSAIDPIVSQFIEDEGLTGAGLIVVDRDDGVIYENHWGDFDEDRVSLIMSSSKMITAGVLMRLDDDGLLDVDAPVADIVEWGAGNPEITPAQLVSNSSGLYSLFDDPSYAPYLCQYSNAGTLQDCAAQIMTTPDDDDVIRPPDSSFNYGGGQWQVAGGVAEVASGKSWEQLINEIFVEPCGLDVLGYNSHFVPLEAFFEYPEGYEGDLSELPPTENPNMEGGAYVTTGDYGKLLLMNLRDGMCGDTQVLSTEALARMHGDRIAEVYDGNAYSAGTGYGMGWWVDRDSGRISDAGAYGSVPWLDLEDGYGAYLVIERTSDIGGALANLLFDPVEEAVVG